MFETDPKWSPIKTNITSTGGLGYHPQCPLHDFTHRRIITTCDSPTPSMYNTLNLNFPIENPHEFVNVSLSSQRVIRLGHDNALFLHRHLHTYIFTSDVLHVINVVKKSFCLLSYNIKYYE